MDDDHLIATANLSADPHSPMEDPFETRLAFLQLLDALNATQQSIRRATAFALKHRAYLCEELFECVVEAMEGASMNGRLNLLYLLDSISQHAHRLEQKMAASGTVDAHTSATATMTTITDYRVLVMRALPHVLSLVASDNARGMVNVPSVLKILRNWRAKGTFANVGVDVDVDVLASGVGHAADDKASTPPPSAMELIDEWTLKLEQRHGQSVTSPILADSTSTLSTLAADGATDGTNAAATTTASALVSASAGDEITRKDILARIEEDRERNKLLKQNIWQCNYETTVDTEFEDMWEYVDAGDRSWARDVAEMKREVARMYEEAGSSV